MKQYCKFCQRQLSYLEENSISTSLRCDSCRCWYQFDNDYKLTYYRFTGIHKKSTYIAEFFLNEPRFLLLKDTKPVDPAELIPKVLELDFLPNINPTNFQDKLPTLLTFL